MPTPTPTELPEPPWRVRHKDLLDTYMFLTFYLGFVAELFIVGMLIARVAAWLIGAPDA